MKKYLQKKYIKIPLAFVLGVFLLNLLFPLNRELYEIEYSKIYYWDNGEPMRMTLSKDDFWRFYVQNSQVPSLLKESILTFEDRHFYQHFGINPFSIFRAIFNNLTNSSRIGASTITMQVVKIVEPKERTYLNKIVEVFRAIQLEANFSKEEILNFYFNKAPYGGNIEGLRAAAYFYFGKNLEQLTISEIGILTTIPKNPNVNRPDRQIDLKVKRDKVIKKLLDNSLITQDQFNRAKKEKITSKKEDFYFDVVQYTNSLETDEKTDIKTSINKEMQTYIQEYLKKETQKFYKYQIFNSASVVIDNKTLEIKAYVASNDFNDKANGGENDGVLMEKSPGSTLKPFIYGLALDEGLVTPKKKLLDIPLSFNDYAPHNYDGNYYGEIPMEDALKLSLNIPVVDLQNQLGDNSLFELLEKIGANLTRVKSDYGLAIAVGGIDISLLELTKMFTIFPNDGVYRYTNQQIFSKEASYQISEILSDGFRNKYNGYWEYAQGIKQVAFKTGTSSRGKHLYSIGYTPKYTIGLWFGNFDGKETKGELTGSTVASDTLMDIFNMVDKGKNSWFKKPKNIKKKMICNEYFSSEYCENFVEDEVYTKEKCLELNTQKIEYYVKKRGLLAKEFTKESCYKHLRQSNPMIISPVSKEYLFSESIPKKFRSLKFVCQTYSDLEPLLFLNGKLIKNNSILNLEDGKYNLLCNEGERKFSEVNFFVKSN